MKTANRFSWRRAKDESGQALMLGVVCMAALMGVMALAVDVGYIQYQQVRLQTAADAAAIAAGLEIGTCSKTVCTNMKKAAEQALIEDGITTATITPTSSCSVSTSTSLAMIINVGPCVLGTSDPNNANANIAEVVLTEPQGVFFGSYFKFGNFNLTARAEAGEAYYLDSGGGNCIYTKSLEYNSSDGNFTLNNCGIYDNGNLQTDNGDAVTATTFLYYGTWSPNNCNSSCTWTLGNGETQPTHTNSAQTDPLAGLTAPSQPATQDSNNCSISNQDCWGNNLTSAQENGTAPVNLPPGYYGGGINLNSHIVANLSPGLYYFNGSVNVDSTATLECTTCTGGAGVTLYFNNGTIQPNSGATIELTAPSTGYTSNGNVANMVIWTAANNSSGMTIDASSSSYFNGVIYLPDGTLTLNSGSGTTINSKSTATALDVNNIIVDSGINFEINGSGGYLGGGGQTLGKFALAE